MVMLRSPKITRSGWDSKGCQKTKRVLHQKVLLGRDGCTSRPAAPRRCSEFGGAVTPLTELRGYCLGVGPAAGGKFGDIISFWGWRDDPRPPNVPCPLWPGPTEPQRVLWDGAAGEAWSKGKDPALSPALNPLGLIPKPPPRRAGQLRWEHASPARSPPAFSWKILLLTTRFGASQIGAQH